MQVEILNVMGDDLEVANAARVSFAKEAKMFSDNDEGLLRYLARGMTDSQFNGLIAAVMASDDQKEVARLLWEFRRTPDHWSPFTHVVAKFRVTAPLAIARQLWKSHIGCATQDESVGWNEVSRRYIDSHPQVYVPDTWRKRAANVKQGSSDEVVDLTGLGSAYSPEYAMERSVLAYERLIEEGVCAEQARFVLPTATETTWMWTGSLAFFARVYNLRVDNHAQREAAEIAKLIGEAIEPHFPVSWKVLTK